MRGYLLTCLSESVSTLVAAHCVWQRSGTVKKVLSTSVVDTGMWQRDNGTPRVQERLLSLRLPSTEGSGNAKGGNSE